MSGVGQQHSATAPGRYQLHSVHRISRLLCAKHCAQRWHRRIRRGGAVHLPRRADHVHASDCHVDAVLFELWPVLCDCGAAALRGDCQHEAGEWKRNGGDVCVVCFVRSAFAWFDCFPRYFHDFCYSFFFGNVLFVIMNVIVRSSRSIPIHQSTCVGNDRTILTPRQTWHIIVSRFRFKLV